MGAWMLYMTALAALISGLVLVAEIGVRQLGWPTRFLWLAAMIASVVPVVVLAAAILGGGPRIGSAGEAGSAPEAVMNRLLLLGWAASSIVFLAGLRVSAWTLRRGLMSWRTARVAGETVLVSIDTGPAVIGGRYPRYVVPRGVLAWEEKLQRLVVAHEREHVSAADHRILPFALGLVAVVPWCFPLWWQLHQLREAVESDCDARVVAATGAASDYAGVILALAGRSRRPPLLIPALAPGVRDVERRIRRILGGRGGSPSLPGGSALLAVAAAATICMAAFAARPDRPYFGLERPLLPPPPAPEIVREPPPVFVILGFPLPERDREGENP